MDEYEKLLNIADNLGLEVIEKSFKSNAKGLCKGNKIGISKEIETRIEKRCILAEEMAHSYVTVGDILNTNESQAAKQERHARKIAYEHLLPIHKIVNAYLRCAYDLYSIPDFLGVTPEFMKGALEHYESRYGYSRVCGEYIIYFRPLRVRENRDFVG